jgi:hypothetical protein
MIDTQYRTFAVPNERKAWMRPELRKLETSDAETGNDSLIHDAGMNNMS